MEYSEASMQVATKAATALQLSKKARSSDSHQKAQLGVRRCGNCGGTRHNARTCTKDIEESSKSKLSITCASSLFNSD